VYLDQFAKVFIRARIAGSGLDNRNFREYRRATPKIDHGNRCAIIACDTWIANARRSI
jgi:hypothetical protein